MQTLACLEFLAQLPVWAFWCLVGAFLLTVFSPIILCVIREAWDSWQTTRRRRKLRKEEKEKQKQKRLPANAPDYSMAVNCRV